ncbi:hypothetical protein P3T76_006591 [Phytophthora citrophthora]|uniref:BZIP domain-containing protein n=1 Tax=Phytophthora citrophthora TaxID=4793 RepID=A0AAD9GNX7_9STRA|nr:hypothetical protein P3T76_006591 [Phytophthora citrophthora]
MSTTTTCPPNSQNLTEEVIGNVLQRVWPRHRVGAGEPNTAHQSKKRERSTNSDDTELEAYQRERRRRNQERYRLRQRKLIEDLDETNRKLRSEIERLSNERNSLLCGISTKETMWSVAVEYFRVFQHGLFATEGLPVAELDFLRTMMAADLDANTVYGFGALARNWKVFTLSFKDVHVRLQRLGQVADDSLLATTTTSITITVNPCAICPLTWQERTRIVAKEVDGLILLKNWWIAVSCVIHGSVHFDWNAEDRCVVALITQAEMVTPFRELLGSLEQVSLVFGKALIQPDCNLIIGEHLDKFNLVVERAWTPHRPESSHELTGQLANHSKLPLPVKSLEKPTTANNKSISLKRLREVDIEAYHRERRRRNQKRYRKRQRHDISKLEVDNQQLTTEIESLECRRNKLSYGVPSTKETIWSVASEYFRVFRRDLLRTTMSPEMDAGNAIGLEALARNWRVFTEFFQDVQLQLVRLDSVGENALVATATLSVTISRFSVHKIFPHLVTSKRQTLSSIAGRLLGQRLVTPVSVRFDWDCSSNRVVRLISQGDMLSPMLKVLGNLKDVSLAFSQALVKPDCNLVDADYLKHYTLVVERAWTPHRPESSHELTGQLANHSKLPLPVKNLEKPTTANNKSISLKRLREVDIEAYHRERRRRNQERYRKRQRHDISKLEVDNQQLTTEIESLECRRNKLSYGVPSTKETIWSVASEYFRVFRRGLVLANGNRMPELDLLRATMSPEMDAGNAIGLEALARNWRVFTEFFQDVQLQLVRLDSVGENALVATATLSVTISRFSVHKIFPHLVTSKRQTLSSIAGRLLGQRLVTPVSVRFDWDCSSNRVVRLISQGDMLSPMLKVLGNLKDVSLAFSQALVKPDCNLVDADYLKHYTLCY